MKPVRWLGDRLKDLFYDPTNTKLDTGRVAGWLAILSLLGAAAWNAHFHKEIDLAAFAAGLTTLLGAAAIYLIKDRQNAKP